MYISLATGSPWRVRKIHRCYKHTTTTCRTMMCIRIIIIIYLLCFCFGFGFSCRYYNTFIDCWWSVLVMSLENMYSFWIRNTVGSVWVLLTVVGVSCFSSLPGRHSYTAMKLVERMRMKYVQVHELKIYSPRCRLWQLSHTDTTAHYMARFLRCLYLWHCKLKYSMI